jgi:N-formylmaleamate deformylase
MNRAFCLGLIAAFALLPGGSIAAPPPIATATSFVPTRFTVEVTGTGRDVILIPGLTAGRSVWRGTVARLPGYRYHLIQVSGFAGSPARANASGAVVAPLAEEIAHYIAANRLQRAALVGHSMGGTLAMMVAARHPALVGKVMVVDMLPQPAGLLGSSAAGLRGLADTLRDLGSTPGGRNLIDSAIRLFGNDAAENTQSDPDVVARATHELAVTDLSRELPKIAAPLTVIYASPEATRNAAVDRAYAAAYAPRRGASLIRVDNSGHMVMYDQPTRFGAALKAFLAP